MNARFNLVSWRDELVTAIGAVALLIGTATGNAIAMLAIAMVALAVITIVFWQRIIYSR